MLDLQMDQWVVILFSIISQLPMIHLVYTCISTIDHMEMSKSVDVVGM